MRFDKGEVEEEGVALMGVDEFFGLFDHQGRGVGLTDPIGQFHLAIGLFGVAWDGLFVDDDFLIVPPKVRRVETVGDRLTIVAEEETETLFVGIAGAADRSEAPFANSAGLVSGVPECHREGVGFGGKGVLAFGVFGGVHFVHGPVAADLRMPEVFACHKDTARGGADGGAGIVVGQTGSRSSEGVEIGGWDLFLTEGSDFPPAEIVSKDENDIQFFFSRGELGEQGDGQDKGEESRHSAA